MSLRPLVSIIGTTGVGKSRLAIDLALALSSHAKSHGWTGAKVVNADSMQVYAGADVITNKVPESQRRGVEHLLMGFKQLGEQYVVGEWVNDAVREIDTLHRGKALPIVVGGTSYWMQNLIFPNRLASFDGPPTPSFSPALEKSISSLPAPLLELFLNLPERPEQEQAFALHELLSALDPRMAARWHWNDTRKVLRSLEIIKEKGALASDVMDKQAQQVIVPRYRTLIFWLHSNPEMLQPRLDARVDEMIKKGLLDDVRMLRRIASSEWLPSGKDDLSIDTTCGIFQSIGFKEFDPYLSTDAPSQALFDTCAARTRVSTRQYAKRQVQWIQNKLLPTLDISNRSGTQCPLYLIEVSDLEKWDAEVRDVAVSLVHDFLAENDLPDPRSLSETAKSLLHMRNELQDPSAVLAARRKIICELCTGDPRQPCMLDEGIEWHTHLRSRKHRRRERERARLAARSQRVEARRIDAERTSQDSADDLDDLNLESDIILMDS